jgi:hypothetical protein
MKKQFWYAEGMIRFDYSRHVLRAMREGFYPMSLKRFANQYARAYYLTGRVHPMQ